MACYDNLAIVQQLTNNLDVCLEQTGMYRVFRLLNCYQ